ncbi:hypothetical protein LIER_14834 [Lithospermum erythrorhizon]|uniref:Reverse transcriptase zinc-binding domain-containing protein n=1 Tax=Lithospermum erythrorhizon TaxID=34254 RepID=A0AAV3Q0J5_LITER
MQTKIKRVKRVLKELKKEVFLNISGRVIEMKHKYEEYQASILRGDLCIENLVRVNNITEEYNKLCDAESNFYRSKARLKWIKDGDASTKLFHTSMRIYQHKNLITKMQNEEGAMIGDYEEIHKLHCFESEVKNMKDFRPISCCNVIYKIISAVLAKRLKRILHKIVGSHQTTYLPGKHISNGVLLMQEWMNGYHMEGFNHHLFCQDIKFINSCSADDLCVLSAATTKSLSLIKKTLEVFGSVTSLMPNLAKSSYLFVGVNANVEKYLCSVIGISKAQLPIKYLGIPLIIKQLCASDCRTLLEKTKVFSTYNYWRQSVFLPVMVIKGITKLIKRFLWGGSTDSRNPCKVRGRLHTKDRLSKWNMISDSKCVFCEACETVEYLFFLCPLSAAVCRKLDGLCKDFHEPRG